MIEGPDGIFSVVVSPFANSIVNVVDFLLDSIYLTTPETDDVNTLLLLFDPSGYS